MSKPSIYFNDYVSLAVMLLMIVALVSEQTNANAEGADAALPTDRVLEVDDAVHLHLSGYLDGHSLTVDVDVVANPDHFRGEDE